MHFVFEIVFELHRHYTKQTFGLNQTSMNATWYKVFHKFSFAKVKLFKTIFGPALIKKRFFLLE